MAKARSATRHALREKAFQVLYSLCFSPVETIGELETAFTNSEAFAPSRNGDKVDVQAREEDDRALQEGQEPEGFAWELVKGVWKNTTALDAIITNHTRNWRKDRIGKIELTILRIAVYEMSFAGNVPAKVAIDEAVELTKTFADEGADSFVNGVLDAVAKNRTN